MKPSKKRTTRRGLDDLPVVPPSPLTLEQRLKAQEVLHGTRDPDAPLPKRLPHVYITTQQMTADEIHRHNLRAPLPSYDLDICIHLKTFPEPRPVPEPNMPQPEVQQ